MMRFRLSTCALCLILIGAVAASAADPETTPPEPSPETSTQTEQPPAEPEPALDQTMQEMMDLRGEAPIVDPERRPDVQNAPGRVGVPAVTVDVDRSVLGVAPGEPQPHLRREGDFVVNRRGRVIRSPDGAHVLFVFEAADKESPEPPMILQACRNLQAMEDIVAERGDAAEFIVSGQVHVYRGANYLLPTMYQLAYDKGNLQN